MPSPLFVAQMRQLAPVAAAVAPVRRTVPFAGYLDETWPRSWSRDAAHLCLIARYLELVEAGRIDRLMINMPPRHGKTETTTVRGAGWMFENSPADNVLVTANTDRLARRFSRKARNIVRERIPLAPDSASTDEWSSLQGGSFVARGVGSPPVGIGFRRIFIDDPVKGREQAESKAYREKAWDWYTDDLLNRLEPGGAIVFTCTRWHEADVAALALASEPGAWCCLSLPALAYDQMDALGRALGEPLWPERYDAEALARIRAVMVQNEGEYGWLATFQQQPTGRVGSFFDQTKIDRVAEPPEAITRRVRAWDMAATKDGGDWTAAVLLGVGVSGRYYILDCVRQRVGPDERDRLMLATARADGRDTAIWFPTDPAAAGKTEALRTTRLLAGYTTRTKTVTGAKTTRANGVASQVNAGNVTMVTGRWNTDLLDELRAFPMGGNDDQVDALADAFNCLVARRRLAML